MTTDSQHAGPPLWDLAGEVSELDVSSKDLASARISFGLLDRLEAAGYLSQDQKRRSQVAFDEAITNALEHGNLELKSEWREQEGERGGDRYSETKALRLRQAPFSERRVNIRLEFDGACVILRVRDEGPGFDPPTLFTVENDLGEKSYGRGLRLMLHFMDAVEFREGGRLIELRKQLPATSPLDGVE